MGVFLADGLQLYLRCEETSGNLIDSSPNALEAAPVSLPEYSQTGILNNCVRLNFGGGTDSFQIPNPSELNIGGPMTISCWSNQFNESGGSGALICRWNGTTERAWLVVYSQTPNTMVFGLSPDGTQTNQSNLQSSIAPITINGTQWYHTLAVYDGASQILYVTPSSASELNTPDSQAYSSGIWTGSTDRVDIGYLSTAGPGRIHGSLDEIGIWDRALNAEERAALFGGGTPPEFSTFKSESDVFIPPGGFYYG